MEREPSGKERRLTWQQTSLIAGYERMGHSITGDLVAAPSLRDELSGLLHDSALGYEEVLRAHFMGSGRNLQAVVESPFVRAFMTTTHCTDEERDFLARTREIALAEGDHQQATSDFQEWAETRIPFMAKGFQRSVLDGNVIAPLTPDEIAKRSAEAHRLWREANPELAADIQRRASKAGGEAGPRVFTPEIRAQIQELFDKGLVYRVVAQILQGRGIKVNGDNVRDAVAMYDDLHYTPAEKSKRQRKGFLAATGDIFNLSGSRSQTREILQKLGYSSAKVEAALRKLGLRERMDWTSTVTIDGQAVTLEDIASRFIGNSPTPGEEYRIFSAFLKEKGNVVAISRSSYYGIRRKILRTK